jgi:hypothetical protein
MRDQKLRNEWKNLCPVDVLLACIEIVSAVDGQLVKFGTLERVMVDSLSDSFRRRWKGHHRHPPHTEAPGIRVVQQCRGNHEGTKGGRS